MISAYVLHAGVIHCVGGVSSNLISAKSELSLPTYGWVR